MKSKTTKKPETGTVKEPLKPVGKIPTEVKTKADRIKEIALLVVVLVWAAIMLYNL